MESENRKSVWPIRRRPFGMLALCVALLSLGASANGDDAVDRISASKIVPRYFCHSDGKGWIPVGCNICFDRLNTVGAAEASTTRERFGRWLDAFADNGGDFVRLWLGHPSLEVMPTKAGEYDPVQSETLKFIVGRCEARNIRLKLTLESFRSVCSDSSKAPNPFFNRTLYSAHAKKMREFYASETCRDIYLGKAAHLKSLGFGESPAVICLELWNEINSTAPTDVYADWSDRMIGDLKRLFPNQMVVQNLGSYSDPGAYRQYRQLGVVKGNDFLQIHRYLDPGAQLDVCRGPMDVLAAQSIRDLWAVGRPQPVLLAEVGAVKANHTGPSILYENDTEGTLLHDALFAPFFAGAAGCGQFWHWDHQYLDRHKLWWHFRRFAKAVEGLDPVAEDFRPFYTETRRLRVYVLEGKKTTVVWCRDKTSDWRSELVDGNRARSVVDAMLPVNGVEFACYLPWEDRSITCAAPKLPPFLRSIVVRYPAKIRFEDTVEQH